MNILNYKMEAPTMPQNDGPGGASAVESIGNNIYFYSEVSDSRILALNRALKDMATRIQMDAVKSGVVAPIWLYIMSPGGSVFAGLSALDTIEEIRKKVPVYTVVDGYAASAGTFISLAGSKRYIRPNSVMLIHQLSSVFWGKYEEMKDEIQNLDLLMSIIVSIYEKRTSVPVKRLEQVLKKDLWWDAVKCKSMNLVDEILE